MSNKKENDKNKKNKKLKILKKEDVLDPNLDKLTDKQKKERKEMLSKASEEMYGFYKRIGISLEDYYKNVESAGKVFAKGSEQAILNQNSLLQSLGIKDVNSFFEQNRNDIERAMKAFNELGEMQKLADARINKVFSNREFTDFVNVINKNVENLGNAGKIFDNHIKNSIKSLNFDSYYNSLRSLSISFTDDGRFIRTKVYLPDEVEPLIEYKKPRNSKFGLLIDEILLNYIKNNNGLKYHMTKIVKEILLSILRKENTDYKLGGILVAEETTEANIAWTNLDKADGKVQFRKWENLKHAIKNSKNRIQSLQIKK